MLKNKFKKESKLVDVLSRRVLMSVTMKNETIYLSILRTWMTVTEILGKL